MINGNVAAIKRQPAMVQLSQPRLRNDHPTGSPAAAASSIVGNITAIVVAIAANQCVAIAGTRGSMMERPMAVDGLKFS